jgi:hypothetical protein
VTVLSVKPRWPVPLITGGELLPGGDRLTAAVALLWTAARPCALIAVTLTLIRAPSSDLTRRYLERLAPLIRVQVRPPFRERSHW